MIQYLLGNALTTHSQWGIYNPLSYNPYSMGNIQSCPWQPMLIGDDKPPFLQPLHKKPSSQPLHTWDWTKNLSYNPCTQEIIKIPFSQPWTQEIIKKTSSQPLHTWDYKTTCLTTLAHWGTWDPLSYNPSLYNP